jgi:phosphate starvation-inducible protein PhoH and related proteins
VKPTYQGETDLSRNRSAKAQKRMQVFENTIPFNTPVKQKPKSVELVPKTRNQEQLILQLLDDSQHIVVAVGPAGTGKTYLAMQAAVRAFRNGDCDSIILTRPAVGVEDEQHGFLPGNLVAKMEPWTRPLLDVLREYYRPQDIVAMIEDQTIEISPLAYMRGRTFKNAWIIADEMQNATPAQMKMLLSRIGVNSKIVVTGDVEQADRHNGQNGLLDLCDRLKENSVKGMSVSEFTARDIQRHPIINSVLKLYE